MRFRVVAAVIVRRAQVLNLEFNGMRRGVGSKKMKYKLFALTIALMPLAASAIDSCGSVPVRELVVQGSRENGAAWANTARISVTGSACVGIDYAYMSLDNPALPSILSVLMSAQAQGRSVDLVVKSATGISATAKEIEYIRLP